MNLLRPRFLTSVLFGADLILPRLGILPDGQILLEGLCEKAAAVSGRKDAHLVLQKEPKGAAGWHQHYRIPWDQALLKSSASSNLNDDAGDAFDLHLFKPKALMNVNGPPIVKAARTHLGWNDKIPKYPGNLVAVHDELELAPGTFKVHPGGSSLKGHRGLESLAKALESKSFTRFRLGIGRPLKRDSMVVAKHVLSPVQKTELDLVSYDVDRQRGGRVLEDAWREVHRLAIRQLEAPNAAPKSP